MQEAEKARTASLAQYGKQSLFHKYHLTQRLMAHKAKVVERALGTKALSAVEAIHSTIDVVDESNRQWGPLGPLAAARQLANAVDREATPENVVGGLMSPATAIMNSAAAANDDESIHHLTNAYTEMALDAGVVQGGVVSSGTRSIVWAPARSAWKTLGGGVRIRKLGNYWIKQVNPDASRVSQWYGRRSISDQASALQRLGDMAPSFRHAGDKIITRDVGRFAGGTRAFLSIWKRGSRRLGYLNDIRPRNIGANGQIFDPALTGGRVFLAGAAGAVAGGVAIGKKLAE